jgi:N,N'-diacetyllegionaminate synthase
MNKVIIIAEAGVNHNGDINIAKKMIDSAADCGVDYIKFQTFITELIVDRSAPKAEYQDKNIGSGKSQFDMIKELELSFEDFIELREYCKKRNVKFLTSVADLVSLSRLEELGVEYIKISSGEIANPLFLEAVSKKKLPVLLSTGMATLGEIENAIRVLTSNGLTINDVTVLHCNTEYPTPMADVNLKAMETIANSFKVRVGYSDHTMGIEVPIGAVALGACVIEKHFTLDRSMHGPDHTSSLEPAEFSTMVKCIRNIELAISGDGRKIPTKSEIKNLEVVRKSIFVSKPIEPGEIFSVENIMVKRPGDGISATDVYRVIGKPATRKLNVGQKLTYSDIQW